MSRTLNLIVQLLARGRKLHRLGATQQALDVFTRLTALQQLPAGTARRVQVHLALIRLRQRRFASARRHLAALLVHQPDHAGYHYLMARAVAADSRCNPERALDHCRQAAHLAPRHAGYLSTFGLLAVRQGQHEEGLAALQQARELAPEDPRMLRRLAEGLCLADRAAEARRVLLAGLFHSGGDQRFRQLWNNYQFQQLHGRQQQRHRQVTQGQGRPMVLPFLRPVLAEEQPAGRVDSPAVLAGPHPRRSLRRPDWRHAQ